MTAILPDKVVALDNELRTAFGLLKHGLASLQAIDMANDFYQLPLLLLANGLERLCKCALALKYYEEMGHFPSQKELKKKWGHDVKRLVNDITSTCYPPEYLKRPIARADRDFLTSDPLLDSLLDCLSGFGKGGRYYELDVICGDTTITESPESSWQKVEMEIVIQDPALKEQMYDPKAGNSLYIEINRCLTSVLERLIRAICRLFTFGPLGGEAERFSGTLGDFLYLTDDDLGIRDYGKILSKR